VKIEYKTESSVGLKRKALTPCPFNRKTANGFTIAVGSLGCEFCRDYKCKTHNDGGGVVECSAGEER